MSAGNTGVPQPIEIKLRKQSRLLEVAFDDGQRFELSFEYLRVYSPSAEVRGHGPGQETLQLGKHTVDIRVVEPVGNYAVKPVFSDGHESGIFSWDYLYFLGAEQARLWAEYTQRLEAAGAQRDTPMVAAGGHGCSSH